MWMISILERNVLSLGQTYSFFCVCCCISFLFSTNCLCVSCPAYLHSVRLLHFLLLLLRTKAQHRSCYIYHQVTWTDSCLVFPFCHFFLIDLTLYKHNLHIILSHSHQPLALLPHKEHASTGAWANLLELDSRPKFPIELASFLPLLWTHSYRPTEVPIGHQIQSLTQLPVNCLVLYFSPWN